MSTANAEVEGSQAFVWGKNRGLDSSARPGAASVGMTNSTFSDVIPSEGMSAANAEVEGSQAFVWGKNRGRDSSTRPGAASVEMTNYAHYDVIPTGGMSAANAEVEGSRCQDLHILAVKTHRLL